MAHPGTFSASATAIAPSSPRKLSARLSWVIWRQTDSLRSVGQKADVIAFESRLCRWKLWSVLDCVVNRVRAKRLTTDV